MKYVVVKHDGVVQYAGLADEVKIGDLDSVPVDSLREALVGHRPRTEDDEG